MHTDLTQQFPFYAILLENVYHGPGDPGKVPAGTILLVLEDATGSYLVDIADGETNTQQQFWVLQSSVAHLCDVCQEEPATTEARWHHGMLCDDCFGLEPEIVAEAAAMLDEQAPKGSLPWHMEEA